MRVLIVVLTLLSMPVFAADPHAQHRATAAMAADHGDSLFHLDAEWDDHRGATLAPVSSDRHWPAVSRRRR